MIQNDQNLVIFRDHFLGRADGAEYHCTSTPTRKLVLVLSIRYREYRVNRASMAPFWPL